MSQCISFYFPRKRVILASASEVRVRLLREYFGVEPIVISSNVDEESIFGATPERTAVCRAEAKVASVVRVLPESLAKESVLVIGADNLVNLGGIILGKPKTRECQREFFGRFSGTVHQAICGVAVYELATERLITAVEVCDVYVCDLSVRREEMEAYILSGRGLKCAGGYDFCGDELCWFLACAPRGSRTAIRGLPVELISRMLRVLDS